jgi:Uma2 family endonuclease
MRRTCTGGQPIYAVYLPNRQERQGPDIDKRDEYMTAGVQEYWIIHRFRRRMTVVRRGDNEVTEMVVTERET